MEKITLETLGGDSFYKVAKKAKIMAIQQDKIVSFDFNGIECLVSQNTNTDWLYRDYSDAHLMEWKEIGPDCKESYSAEIEEAIRAKKIESEKRHEQERTEYKRKEDAERNEFTILTKDEQMQFSNKELWDSGREKNKDPYGNCIYEYAEGWAKLMQIEIAKGSKVKDCAKEASFKLGFLGITGFMYGAAVSVLSQTWQYGEDLRKWHNKDYGHEGDGVVNPAVLTIG